MDVVVALRTAQAYLDGGAPLDALLVLDTVAGHLEQDAAGQLLLARAYFASAQLGRAQAALERVLALDPVDSWARFLLGRTLERAGRPEQALAQYRLAVAMSPREEYAEQRDLLTARLAA